MDSTLVTDFIHDKNTLARKYQMRIWHQRYDDNDWVGGSAFAWIIRKWKACKWIKEKGCEKRAKKEHNPVQRTDKRLAIRDCRVDVETSDGQSWGIQVCVVADYFHVDREEQE